MTRTILIVGGGFGGVTAAKRLARGSLPDTELVLLTDKPCLEYYAALYRLIAGHSPSEARLPLSHMLPARVRVVRDSAISVDPAAKTVTGKSGNILAYDTLILAPGSEPAYFNIPGMREHSLSMKSVEEALKLRRLVLERVDAMQKTDAANERERAILGRFVVIGAGPTGVEIASEILPLAQRRACEHGLDPSLIRVDLVEGMDRVLPIVEPDASARTLRQLQKLGISVLLQRIVASAEARSIRFKDGQTIDAATIIWTAGVKASGLLASVPGLELDKRGRVAIDEQLHAKNVRDIFVIGDCAATPYAGLAQTAVEDAIFVARVIAADRRGTPLPAYHPKAPAYAIPAGPYWAAVKYGPLRVYGILGYALRRAADIHVYALLLPWWRIPAAFFGTAKAGK